MKFVNQVLVELKSRSKYVLVLKDYKNDGKVYCEHSYKYKDTKIPFLIKTDDPKFSLKKGEVIRLSDGCNGNNIMTSAWAIGESNKIEGKFPCDCVYVIPTIEEPSQHIIVRRQN